MKPTACFSVPPGRRHPARNANAQENVWVWLTSRCGNGTMSIHPPPVSLWAYAWSTLTFPISFEMFQKQPNISEPSLRVQPVFVSFIPLLKVGIKCRQEQHQTFFWFFYEVRRTWKKKKAWADGFVFIFKLTLPFSWKKKIKVRNDCLKIFICIYISKNPLSLRKS